MVNEKLQSPATRARALADEGAQLTHPDVLNEDVRWRSARLFTAEELNFETPAAAIAWMENLSSRPDGDQLRHAVLNIKRELELVTASDRTSNKDRALAAEVSQWLTVWLQNPRIFADWFVLRRNTPEFHRLFGS
ncbi:MAG TPA: hypothetical protein VFS77_04950 [Pyrinomonadaceae bacterium]|nr:hypothetical protein [Pyrinomonadaceae bacterium]